MPHEPYTGLATTFDTAAELYEQARPRYPGALFDDLAAQTGLTSGVRHDGEPVSVLEIGVGTGQATRDLLSRGWRVLGLEPGAELARVARRVLAGLGDVEVVVSPFESWDGAPESYDMVFAATSWHWLDPQVALPRAARLLRPGGTLALVSTEHVLPEDDGDPFFRELEQAYDAVGMGDGRGGPQPPHTIEARHEADIVASRLFTTPQVRRHVWQQTYTAEEYVAVLSTYSNHIAVADEVRAQLFADVHRRIAARPGGVVRKHYLATLHTAQRR